MGEYGYSIEHILMVDIIPDPAVRKAMNEINAGYFLLSFDVIIFHRSADRACLSVSNLNSTQSKSSDSNWLDWSSDST